MLHEPIAAADDQSLRATSAFKRSGYGKKRKRSLYQYAIYPPYEAPYLPSDEVLRGIIALFPDIRLWEIERFPDRDMFFVYGRKQCMFSTRASPELREMREEFLARIGQAASAERDLGPITREAAEEILAENDFVKIIWTGKAVVAHDNNRKTFTRQQLDRGQLRSRFRRLEAICRDEPPFILGAAQ